MSLASVIKGKQLRPPRMLVYGPPGIGKTTFAASAPSPIIVQCEDGADGIDADKFPIAASIDDVYSNLVELRTQQHDYGTVIVDTVDWCERLIQSRVAEDNNVRAFADIPYGKGPGYALDYWKRLVCELDRVRNHGMAVILLSHSKVEKVNDPDGPQYDRHSPDLHKDASAMLVEWCDAVGFASIETRIEKQDMGFNKTRAVAHAVGLDGGDRNLRLVNAPACLAKNRYGITGKIPLAWSSFMTCVNGYYSTASKK